MNDTEKDHRIKRLKYRANHRGIKEMDIILGRFANAQLDGMDDDHLDDFERLMQESDRDLLTWFTHETPMPIEELAGIFSQVAEFLEHPKSHD